MVVISKCAMLAPFYYIFFSVPLPVLFTICGTLTFTVVIYVKSFLQSCEEPPKLYYRDSTLAKYVLKRCKRLSLPFRPPVWAHSAHVQTLLPLLLPKVTFHFEREFLMMRDRGIVALDWGISGTARLPTRSAVLLVIPGFNGDAQSASFICRRAVQRGFRPIVFNKRGLGGSPLTTPKLQSYGDPSDFRQVIKYIRSSFTEARIVAVGIGVGSGLLVSYLGEYGSSSYISAAVCQCPAYKLQTFFHKLRQPYDFAILYSQKRLLCKHRKALEKVIDVSAALRTSRCSDFEEVVYSRLYGYKDTQEYWERNEPDRDMDDVSPPVLCINSADDPICGAADVPYELFSALPNFMLAMTSQGGHCGFIERPSFTSWADKVALDYLQAVLDFLAKHDR